MDADVMSGVDEETQRRLEEEIVRRRLQEEEDLLYASALADEDERGRGGLVGGVSEEVEGLGLETEKRIQEEKDLSLALQLEGGRTMEDIERMEVAFGLDPCEVLRPDDVMEKVVWKVATKCVNLLNSSGRMYNRAHVSSEFNYFGSNVWGHGWDCGYKNLQMIFSSLLNDKDCKKHLQQQGILEVPTGRIEEAWRLGFDEDGKRELGGNLLDETKWIGTTEVAALLRSLKIRAEIRDFSASVEKPEGARADLLDFIAEYYESRCHVGRKLSITAPSKCFRCISDRTRGKPAYIPPLFLQHPGHSRTVMGVELYRSQSHKLLALDPNMGFRDRLESNVNLSDLELGKDSEDLLPTSYQVVYLSKKLFYDNDDEWRRSRTMSSH